MGTIVIITAALLGGLVIGLPAGYWAGYWHGRSDGRLAERTRFLLRDIRKAEHERLAAARPAGPWYSEVTPKHAAPPPPLAEVTLLTAGTKAPGWDMPAHTAWTGPLQALPGPHSDPDGLGRVPALVTS